jgi:hypothetical protein
MTTMPRLLVALVLVALALPAGATAKELASATVCGTSGCRTIEDPPIALMEAGDGYPEAAPADAPYHTVRYVALDGDGADNTWTVLWVPSTQMIGFSNEAGEAVFEEVAAGPAAAYHDLTAGVEPYAAVSSWEKALSGESGEGSSNWLRWAILAVVAVLVAAAAALWLTRSRWRGSPGSTPRPATPR